MGKSHYRKSLILLLSYFFLGAYIQIEDEGVARYQRQIMNFIGAGVDCSDAGGKTVCTINDAGVGSGDNVRAEIGDNGGTYQSLTDVDFDDNGDIDFVPDTATAPDQITAIIRANKVTNLMIRDSAGTSVIGKSTAGAGDPADIAASADGDVLRRAAGVLGFGTIPASSVTGITALDQVGGESDLRYDATMECYYEDVNEDAAHALNATEQCYGEHAYGDATDPTRRLYCNPGDYENNGTSTTDGIQECIDYVASLGGGTVKLGPRVYENTGSVPIIIDNTTAEVRLEGAGVLSTTIKCRSGAACTAPSTIDIVARYTTLSDLWVVADRGATAIPAVQIGNPINADCTAANQPMDCCTGAAAGVCNATSNADCTGAGAPLHCCTGVGTGNCTSYGYPSHIRFERVRIDGDNTDAAGARQGTGIIHRGLRNTFDQVDINYFATAMLVSGNALGTSNANDWRSLRISSCDNGIDTTVGKYVANQGDAQALDLVFPKIESINSYGITLRGGSADGGNSNSLHMFSGWLEGAITGVRVLGSASAYDPQVSSVDNSYASMSSTYGITADASTGSDITSDGDHLNSVNCIQHLGSGKINYRMDLESAAPCVPTVGGTAVLRDYDLDIAFKDEASRFVAAFGIPYGTAFPGSPATGDVFVVTDDSAAGACDSAAGAALSFCRWSGAAWVKLGDGGGGGGGAPTTATYITQTPDGTLSAEQALSLLGTGILFGTTGTGVVSSLGPVAVAQGDLLYGSAANTLLALAKNTTATRYLSNTGGSNNPAWAQVNLTNGITSLPGADTQVLFNDAAAIGANAGMTYAKASTTLTVGNIIIPGGGATEVGISTGANSTAGQQMTMLEDTDFGTSKWGFDIGGHGGGSNTNLAADKIIRPDTAGLILATDMLSSSATARILGRATAGAGVIEELTGAQVIGLGSFEATVDFGAAGSFEALATITATTVTASSKILCAPTMFATADRPDGNDDALLDEIDVQPYARNAGVNFKVKAHSPKRSFGRFIVQCTIGA